jgi:hypothetical protein
MQSALTFGVTSVGLSDGSTTPIFTVSGSPVTTSGTLTETLLTESANTVFAGPSSGGNAQPAFRALASADVATVLASPPAIGGTTANVGNFTVLAGSTSVISPIGSFGALGSITPGTGAFTTLSATSEQTTNLTGQTANTAIVTALFENTTAASSGNQQYACTQLTGYGWGTTAPSSQSVAFQICDEPVQSTVPTGNLVIQSSIAGGAYSTDATFTSGGGLNINAAGDYSWVGATAYIGQSGNTISIVSSGVTYESLGSAKVTFLEPIVSAGTTFTIASGTGACATTTTLEGGRQAGDFLCTGTTGASTVTLTLSASTTAYSCVGRDVTTPTATVPTQTGATSTTSVTLTLGTVTANDKIQFHCIGY